MLLVPYMWASMTFLHEMLRENLREIALDIPAMRFAVIIDCFLM